jgi:putative membrane protein
MLAAWIVVGCNRGRGVEAARESQIPSVSPAEQDFMMKATQADVAEIDMARLALEKSANRDIKDYATMIESDHNKALEDLTDLMKDTNVSQQRTMPADAQQEFNRLNDLTGAEFDREFVNTMVMDHQKAIAMFQNQRATVQNPDVKKYVDDTLPTLQTHLEKAQQLQSRLFGGV